MTDVDLIEKKLAFIETCVRQLRDLGQPERIPVDLREERFAAHTLKSRFRRRRTSRPTSCPKTGWASRKPTASYSIFYVSPFA